MLAAVAVAVLGVYRLASATVPTVWMVSGAIGLGMGRLVQALTGRPLWIGASFGGVDFLVVMGVVYALWLRWTRPPRVGRAVYAAAAILAGYFGYLVVLAFSTDLLAALPELPAPPSLDPGDYRPPDWSWSAAVRTLIPWNLPLVAVLVEAAVAALMFRWAAWKPVEETDTTAASLDSRSRTWRYGLPVGLAVATAVLLTFAPFRSDLTGKTIVAHQRGQVNWAKPQHGQYEPDWAGTYGTLPDFVASLGGKMLISPELSEDDLAAADVLLLAHPIEPWTPGELERIEAFVRRGGSLLVVAGPTVRETADRAAVNDVLKPTGMALRDDVAVPIAPRWLDAAWGMAHPATLGLDNRRGGFGLRVTSSIATRWPARPILVGQWGFGDPGNDAATAGVFRFEPGEKLGDLVLAAERPLGHGTVVVVADDTCLSSVTNATSYPFTGRLLSYLARRPSSPQDWWRQTLGLLGCLGLMGLLLWRPGPNVLIVLAAALAVSVAAATGVSRHVARVVPGDPVGAARVAYIDASHLESYNDEPWSNDGIDAAVMTLARNGFVPLVAAGTDDRASESGGAADLDRPGATVFGRPAAGGPRVRPARRRVPVERGSDRVGGQSGVAPRIRFRGAAVAGRARGLDRRPRAGRAVPRGLRSLPDHLLQGVGARGGRLSDPGVVLQRLAGRLPCSPTPRCSRGATTTCRSWCAGQWAEDRSS